MESPTGISRWVVSLAGLSGALVLAFGSSYQKDFEVGHSVNLVELQEAQRALQPSPHLSPRIQKTLPTLSPEQTKGHLIDSAGYDIVSVAFCGELNPDGSCITPRVVFEPSETIYFVMSIEDRPDFGAFDVTIYFQDIVMERMTFDTMSVPPEQRPQDGEVWHFRSDMTPRGPQSVGGGRGVEVSTNGTIIGRFPYQISRPTSSSGLTIWNGGGLTHRDSSSPVLPPNPTFGRQEPVRVVGSAGLGEGSWVGVVFAHNGRWIQSSSRTDVVHTNETDHYFEAQWLPPGGWTAGNWEATILQDGMVMTSYPFTVQ